jgi:hypothetical protein
MPRVILALAIIGIAVYALADLAGTRREDAGGIPKAVWAVLIVLAPVVGPLGWIVMRYRMRKHEVAARGSSGRSVSNAPGGGPLAPDDDPEFLWRLEQERRRRSQNS